MGDGFDMGEKKDIRYAELRFTVAFRDAYEVPRFKASAIRGGIGQMLLGEYCIRDRLREENGNKCDKCDFLNECIVNRIMYAPMDIEPKLVHGATSEGYIVECDNRNESVEAGEEMQITLVLFGKCIFYLSQYLSAMYRLGYAGLGREHAQFEVVAVKNSFNEDILSQGNIYKDKYVVRSLADYVGWRLGKLDLSSGQLELRLITPLSIKRNGDFIKELEAAELIKSLLRRIYIMQCFEGIASEEETSFNDRCEEQLEGIRCEVRNSRFTEIPRYSQRKQDKIFLKGVTGNMIIDFGASLPEKREHLAKLLVAGELLHVGSNTSFGFGKYRIG